MTITMTPNNINFIYVVKSIFNYFVYIIPRFKYLVSYNKYLRNPTGTGDSIYGDESGSLFSGISEKR